MSDSVRPHRRQPTRLPCPWDSPGKNTGVGCHFLLQCTKVKSESEVPQSCPTLSDPMDCSLTGSSVHGIFQARVLEWGAIAFSEGYLSKCAEISQVHLMRAIGKELTFQYDVLVSKLDFSPWTYTFILHPFQPSHFEDCLLSGIIKKWAATHENEIFSVGIEIRRCAHGF